MKRAAKRGGTFCLTARDAVAETARHNDIARRLQATTVTSHLMATFARVNLAFERGEGVWLIATDGERYLDFTSGVAVNALGHAHPRLVAALTEQAKKV